MRCRLVSSVLEISIACLSRSPCGSLSEIELVFSPITVVFSSTFPKRSSIFVLVSLIVVSNLPILWSRFSRNASSCEDNPWILSSMIFISWTFSRISTVWLDTLFLSISLIVLKILISSRSSTRFRLSLAFNCIKGTKFALPRIATCVNERYDILRMFFSKCSW